MNVEQQDAQNQNAYRYENNDRYGASGGQTRDRDDERHDKGKHEGAYKHDRDDERHGRGDDDHDRGRSGRD